MQVVIAGGTGLIGRALAAHLVDHNYQVTVLSRQPRPAAALGLPDGVRVERWDGRTAEGWGSLADGAHAIVNLAGESLAAGRWTAERKQRILNSRVNAGRAIVEAVQKAAKKPGVVVQSSAVGYYGPRGDEDVTEDTAAGDDFLARVCVSWEASTASVAEVGVRHVVIRSGLVLSAEGGALPRMALPFRLFMVGRLGSGRQWLPWIHIADEVSAVRFLIEQEKASGPFNLTAPHPLTNEAFSGGLAGAMNRPAWMPVPAFMLRLLLGEMATTVLTGQQALPRRLLDLGFAFRFPQAEPALRDLLR